MCERQRWEVESAAQDQCRGDGRGPRPARDGQLAVEKSRASSEDVRKKEREEMIEERDGEE